MKRAIAEQQDSLGPVPIPVPPTIAAFPLRPDFGGGVDFSPIIAVHTFDQPGLKTEQRYLMSPSTVRRFRFVKTHLSCTEYDDLKAHWEEAQGAYAQFPYTVYKPLPYVPPNGPIHTTETVTVRYENALVSFDYMVALLVNGPGLTFLEIPQTVPSYTPGAPPLTRFPDSTLSAALADQDQEIVPLITITPRDGSQPLYLSNQHVTVGPNTYLPRLLDWSGITQSIGENADACSMNFGNADGVWTTYINQVSLYGAAVAFAFYHVQSTYLVNLWQGSATNWSLDTSGRFQINVADGTFLLSLAYPSRKILRTCWKVYKGRWCPSTSDLPDCPKDWDSCNVRGVPQSFGGIVVPAQAVRIKDNSTGVLGWGRSTMTSVTVSDDTIYQRPLQEIYTDESMNVTCDVAAGRDESDFYAALGIVGEGPISGYNNNLILQTLDGQPPHDPFFGGGWRYAQGEDPANSGDFVGITQAPWNVPPPNSTFAAGIAFVEIRRTDPKGLQLSAVSDHAIIANVTSGIGGWVWNGPGQRVWTPGLANTVWVALNTYLRAIGLRVDPSNQDAIPAYVMEQYFDLNQTMAMAAICDTVVPKLIPADGSTELQFPFRGVLKEQKPVRDWLREIMNGALGFYVFVNGKWWPGLRFNSSVLAGNAFTRAHLLYKSLVIAPPTPSFNWLVGNFGDEEFGFQLNNVTIYDIDHASYLGTPESPTYLTNTMSYVGISNKSQCARVITCRLREEIGGLKSGSGPHGTDSKVDEQMNARNFQFRTTLLALNTMVGDIISLTHPSLPNGGYVEGRVSHWSLNPDWTIDIQASSTTDDMYDQVAGPKPVDVSAPMVPPETLQTATGLAWMPNQIQPVASDPVYPPWERTFELRQEYLITTDGVYQPTIYVMGQMTMNRFISLDQPRIMEIALASGGTLSGPLTVYATVVQSDINRQPGVPSNLTAIWIPAGVTGQQVVLTVSAAADPVYAFYDVYAGIDRRRMAWQWGSTGGPPTTIAIPGPIHDMTLGLPEGAAWGIKVGAKHVWHAGIAGLLVNGVAAPNQIQSNDFIGSGDNWVGQIAFVCSNIAGDVPLWNFQVTAFDPTTGTLTVTPDCVPDSDPSSVNNVQPGDVLVVYSFATSATANTITNTMWANSVNLAQSASNGFQPDQEIGRVVRILRGTGAGQWRSISSNNDITLTVSKAWDVIPDTTSIFIVEEPSWPNASVTSQMIAPYLGVSAEIRVEVPNLAGTVALVGGFLVDVDGNATDDSVATYRMIYVFGQPPSVRVIGPDPLDGIGNPWILTADDQTILVDTSANDISLTLPPLAVYQGRSALVYNQGPNTTFLATTPPDTFADGTGLTEISTAGGMIDITAAGVYE